MGAPDGAHTHGGGLNGRLVAAAAVIGAIAVTGGASGLLAGLTDLLIWVASVMGATVIVGGAIAIRAMRRGWKPNYIRSVHGKSAHDLMLDERARLRREVGMVKEIHRELEVSRLRKLLLVDEAPAARATWPMLRNAKDEVWVAEVLSDVPDELPGRQ